MSRKSRIVYISTRELNLETGKFQNKIDLIEHIQVYKELRTIAKDQKNLKHKFRNASFKLEYLFDKRVDADYNEDLTFKEIEINDTFEDAILYDKHY